MMVVCIYNLLKSAIKSLKLFEPQAFFLLQIDINFKIIPSHLFHLMTIQYMNKQTTCTRINHPYYTFVLCIDAMRFAPRRTKTPPPPLIDIEMLKVLSVS